MNVWCALSDGHFKFMINFRIIICGVFEPDDIFVVSGDKLVWT
jgi:hypothetical protein